ncbi:MAG: putative RiPP precursor [Solirubrobacteraceae bacterium]
MSSEDPKVPYTPPVVEDLGSLLDLTQHNSDGASTDATFPAGTPRGSITFS